MTASIALVAACGTDANTVACDAWRSHLHNDTAFDPPRGDSEFDLALRALSEGAATARQSQIVFETCAEVGHPIVDSAHTGGED